MHQVSNNTSTIIAKPPTPPAETACPYTPGDPSQSSSRSSSEKSKLSKYNPLNYMFSDLSQEKSEGQVVALPTEREESTIPKKEGGRWEYPSPQQMYNALLRKGYTDTDATAVESMVSVHNFLNEGAWREIVEWERRFGGGLQRGWEICRRGEEGFTDARVDDEGKEVGEPKLVRFQGRPRDMTPKAAMIQVMGKIYPSAFA